MNQYLHFLMEQIKGNIKDKLICLPSPLSSLLYSFKHTHTHTHTHTHEYTQSNNPEQFNHEVTYKRLVEIIEQC